MSDTKRPRRRGAPLARHDFALPIEPLGQCADRYESCAVDESITHAAKTSDEAPDAGTTEEEGAKKKRSLLGFLKQKTEHLVDALDKHLRPVMKKPLTRILAGGAILLVGIPLLISPIPGGIVLVPIGIGIIFGVGPRRTWAIAKRAGRALWRAFFPKKKEDKKERDEHVTEEKLA